METFDDELSVEMAVVAGRTWQATKAWAEGQEAAQGTVVLDHASIRDHRQVL